MALTPYHINGFRADYLPPDAIVSMPLAAVSVAKGDIMKDDGNGYLTNASITGFAAETAFYVAIEAVDNSGGSAGDLNILCVLANDPRIRWIGINEGTVFAQTAVGTIIDINSEDGLKGGTAVTNTGIGFLIEEIDISTAALAASSSKGYAKGRFLILGETT
jgi:hypothetical protein